MKISTAQKKASTLELALRQFKRAIFGEPDLSADEKVWRSVEKDVRKARKQTYRQYYGKG